MRIKLAAALLAGGILSLTALGAAPASAAVPSVAVEAGPPANPDFTPSSNGLKKWMINTLGSVLGKATPDSWQAEQIANEFQYNHSWEAIGAAVDGTPRWDPTTGVPSSYDDYILQGAAQQFNPKTQGGAGGNQYTIPATKATKMQKAVGAAGAAVVAVTGWQLGTSIGSGITNLFGIDSQGLVCSSGAAGLLGAITGADCGALANELAQGEQNTDVSASYGFAPISRNGITVSGLQGYAVQPDSASGTIRYNLYACFVGSRTASQTGIVGQLGISSAPGPVQYEPAIAAISTVTTILCPDMGGYQIAASIGCGQAGLTTCSGYNSFPTQAAATAAQGTITLHCIEPAGVVNCGTGSSAITQSPSNPPRQLACTVHGDDGNDYTANSPDFTETDASIPAPVCPPLPSGVHASNVEVAENGGGQHNVLSSQPTTTAYQHQTTAYPGCDDGGCELLLNMKQPDGTYKDCTDLGTTCNGWFTDANKTDDYRCTFGGQSVELAECNLYSGIFDPARIAAGAPYSDPTTGQWSGGQNGPDESQQAYGTTVQDPVKPRSCDATTASGFDPIAWVMRPVQCALEWAFVPEPMQVKVDMETSKNAWDDTLPAQVITMVQNWAPAADQSGCKISVDLPRPAMFGGGTQHLDVVNACDGPMATLAGISRTITSAVFIVAAALAIRRAAAGSIGYRGD